MELQVIETDFATDPRWDAFVKNHPKGLIYHHSLWLKALRNEFGQKSLSLACVDENNEFKGILPLLFTRGLPCGIHRVGQHATGRRLASLPRTPVAGPLSVTRGADSLLVQEAVRRTLTMPGTTLQIKTSFNGFDDVAGGMKGVSWRQSFVLELPRDTGENIRFGKCKEHHKVAWAVKRAIRMGVKLREARNEKDLTAWYRLYLATMRRVVALPRPYRFFRELWRTMRPLGMMKLLVTERRGAGGVEMLAGSIFLAYNSTFHYAFTGCNASAFKVHSNDLLQWKAIQAACKAGFRYYDFGEVAEQRKDLARFKRKWTAKAVSLYRYQYPPADCSETRSVPEPSDSDWVQTIWQRMPLGITQVVGGQIFRHL